MTKFYTFRQNNSGGSFDHEPTDGIGLAVFVEANDLAHAIQRAERIGLYFNGCDTGRDCSCCGDRWSEPWTDAGTEQPTLYGQPWRPAIEGEEPKLEWSIPSYIHYIGGEFKVATEGARP